MFSKNKDETKPTSEGGKHYRRIGNGKIIYNNGDIFEGRFIDKRFPNNKKKIPKKKIIKIERKLEEET